MAGEPFELQERPEDPEEDGEALSLSDFPLVTTGQPRNDSGPNNFSDRPRRSSSEPPEFFEFLIDLGAHMRSADDLIVSGKLVTLHDQSPPPLFPRGAPTCRRCDSLSELERSSVSRSSSPKAQLARSSRSLNYRKPRRPSSSLVAREAERTTPSSSGRGVARSDSLARKPSRPRWRVLPFGALRLPAEMELRDMRSRQLRRNPSTLFATPAPAPSPADGGGWKGSWKLIRALSCKDPTSVAVATSLACLPHV
ncbi:hypothetical protein ACJRO7_015042 [Eucalyptus globulus]|uniref:Uncharacterized protein n=1 Tax=Eucalyptus globulus TaxID=34317 RepID=A0ABD3L296_EUCGL